MTLRNLSLAAALDYENPTDTGDTAANNTYRLMLSLRILLAMQLPSLNVTITDADENLPEFAAHNGAVAGAATASISIDENTTSVHQFSTNESNDMVDFDGDDKAKFAINSSTGELSFIEAPDFETPQGTPATRRC